MSGVPPHTPGHVARAGSVSSGSLTLKVEGFYTTILNQASPAISALPLSYPLLKYNLSFAIPCSQSESSPARTGFEKRRHCDNHASDNAQEGRTIS